MSTLAEPTLRIRRPASAPVTVAAPAPDAVEGGAWLDQWCAMTTLEERLAAINVLAKSRLQSHAAAEVWLHLVAKATGKVDAARMEQLIRQFLLIAPEHAKASVLYDMLMNAQAPDARPPELVFMITSCERYMPQAQRVLADLQARGATACIMVGDPTLPVAVQEGDLVRLPVHDTYEALPSKVLEGLTFLRRRHGARLSVVKIDDDMRLKPTLDLEALAQTARTFDYAGFPIGDHPADRCWHLGKTSVPTPVFSRRHHGRFAYGPMYLLGPRAIEHLVREWTFYPGEFAGHVYEDRAVGDCLRRASIELKPLAFEDLGGIVQQVERYVAPIF